MSILYDGTIYPVIFLMGTDKAYQHKLRNELDDGNKPVVVTLNIEYVMLVADVIGGIVSVPDVGETVPFSFPHGCNPLLEGGFGKRIFLVIESNGSLGYYSHLYGFAVKICEVTKIFSYSKTQDGFFCFWPKNGSIVLSTEYPHRDS